MAPKELPKKEATLFKNTLKMYEYKQYKKGLKSTDTILKKFPDHGETLVLKGLFLGHLKRAEEGLELAKKGLAINSESGISWNLFGIMNRNARNYEESLKAFINASKYEKDNFQIIRDICYLNVHLRNYESFNEMSQVILNARPANRAFWAGLAVSYHLVEKLDMAIKVLDAYIETFYESKNIPDYEHSELLLYRNQLLQESNQYEKAYEDLRVIETDAFDKATFKVYKARIANQLGDKLQASEILRNLISLNPDCKNHIADLLALDGISLNDVKEEDRERVLTILDDLRRDNPRSHLLKYLPLVYSDESNFEKYAKPFITQSLEKGVPSLFSNLKSLYKNESKKQALFKIVGECYEPSEPLLSPKVNGHDDSQPNKNFWALYYLAQHHDKCEDYSKAMELIDQCIQQAPKVVELLMTKARIYKHMKQMDLAVQTINEARQIDLQDRYVNTKCTKYLIRNDKIEEAEKIISLFIRPDAGDALTELADNQCLWFAIECAKSRYRQKQYGLALKKCHLLIKYFGDFEDDQFDFHAYCLRKSTVKAYISGLQWEDKLYSNKQYIEAVELAIKIYFKIAEDASAARNADNPEYEKLTPEEKKKLRIKQKKAAAKAAQEAEKLAEASIGKKDAVKKDDDPNGLKYFDVKNPLEEAFKIVKPTLVFPNLPISYYQLCTDLFIKQKKLTLGLKFLNHLLQLEGPNEANDRLITEFIKVYQKQLTNGLVPEVLNKALNKQLEKITKTFPDYLVQVIDIGKLKI